MKKRNLNTLTLSFLTAGLLGSAPAFTVENESAKKFAATQDFDTEEDEEDVFYAKGACGAGCGNHTPPPSQGLRNNDETTKDVPDVEQPIIPAPAPDVGPHASMETKRVNLI